MSCDVGEATEGLENEALQNPWAEHSDDGDDYK